MIEVFEIIQNFEQEWLIRLITSIFISLLFWIFAPKVAYVILKAFNLKKKKQDIQKSEIYKPIYIYFRMYGIYISFMYFMKIFNTDVKLITTVKDIYFVLSTFLIAKASANSFTKNSEFYKVLEKKYPKLDSNMLMIILKIIRFVIYSIGFLIVLRYFNIDISGIVAGLGLGGVIVTITAQDTAKNLLAGFMVLVDKPFVVGDWIGIDDYQGTVEEITFRSIRLRAFDNSVILIPNSVIADALIINYSKMFQRRYKTSLTLNLNTPMNKIQDFCNTLVDEVSKNEKVTTNGLYAKFDSINDNGIVVVFQVFMKNPDFDSFIEAKQEVNLTILHVVEELGVELAYPSQTVYLDDVKGK